MLNGCDADPSAVAENAEEKAIMEAAVRNLPERQRSVIQDRLKGMSYEDIAEAMQVSLGTVKSRIARGREELKRRLNGELG